MSLSLVQRKKFSGVVCEVIEHPLCISTGGGFVGADEFAPRLLRNMWPDLTVMGGSCVVGPPAKQFLAIVVVFVLH